MVAQSLQAGQECVPLGPSKVRENDAYVVLGFREARRLSGSFSTHRGVCWQRKRPSFRLFSATIRLKFIIATIGHFRARKRGQLVRCEQKSMEHGLEKELLWPK